MKTALIMAGGTGGHIFPGLAVAQTLQARGWRVHWLGGAGRPGRPSMESQVVPRHGLPISLIDFGGLRGKGPVALALLPWRLLRAFAQSVAVLRRVRPQVVVGLGGYITFPAGLMAVALGKPLVLHEQNSVAGLANRVLAGVAERVFTAFPGTLSQGRWVGNPLRAAFLDQPDPAQRYAGRSGPLRLLVVGGSLGAQALNEVVPAALAQLPQECRPQVLHQSGGQHLQSLTERYAQLGVAAQVVAFIDDTAAAYAWADLVIARAGASTVTELAAVGAPAVLVPYPHAVDDHQTANARFLADAGAAWLLPQSQLTAAGLAQMLQKIERSELMERGLKAKNLQKPAAAQAVADACEELTS